MTQVLQLTMTLLQHLFGKEHFTFFSLPQDWIGTTQGNSSGSKFLGYHCRLEDQYRRQSRSEEGTGLIVAVITTSLQAHAVTTFDDNVTPDVIFGSGNLLGLIRRRCRDRQ